jgi:hypothetical protein
LFFAPLLFGSSIYRQQVTTFSTLAGVGIFVILKVEPQSANVAAAKL